MLKYNLKFCFLVVFLFATLRLMAEDEQPGVSLPTMLMPNLEIHDPQYPEQQIPPLMNENQESEESQQQQQQQEGQQASPSPLINENIEREDSSRVSKSQLKLVSGSIDWRIDGSFGIKGYIQPLSNYSKNYFSGAHLNILGRKQLKFEDVELKNEYFVQSSFDIFAKTEVQSGHFFPLLRDAFLETRTNAGSRILKLGYFLSPMIERERSFWKGYQSGLERAGLWERYSYLKSTEVGLEYGSLNSHLQWRVGFTNTDAEKAEAMAQKDIFLLWEVVPQELDAFYGGVSVQKGWYDGLPLKTSNKDRGFIWWGYRNTNGLQLTIQGFGSVDAVDGLKKPVAEGIDLLEMGGQLVKAKGAAFLIGHNYEWENQKFRLDLKIDELDPDTDRKYTSVQSNSLALTVPQELGQITLGFENTFLEKNHSIGSKQRSTIRLDYIIEI
jgi:hypothetical protein